MIPAADCEGGEGADDVGEDVEGVEGALVGEEALDHFGADTERERYGDEGEVEGAAARAVNYPVEAYLARGVSRQDCAALLVYVGRSVPLEQRRSGSGGLCR